MQPITTYSSSITTCAECDVEVQAIRTVEGHIQIDPCGHSATLIIKPREAAA